jgi:hypothetical protein
VSVVCSPRVRDAVWDAGGANLDSGEDGEVLEGRRLKEDESGLLWSPLPADVTMGAKLGCGSVPGSMVGRKAVGWWSPGLEDGIWMDWDGRDGSECPNIGGKKAGGRQSGQHMASPLGRLMGVGWKCGGCCSNEKAGVDMLPVSASGFLKINESTKNDFDAIVLYLQ